VGNISTPVGGGRWDWSIFVNGTPEEIAKINCVVYHLHPTFPNPDRKVCNPGTDSSKAFQLSSNGWGTFTVAVDLEETNGSINRILYPLTFSPS
jgi:transcription initiation factor IIF auxiliary subunit